MILSVRHIVLRKQVSDDEQDRIQRMEEEMGAEKEKERLRQQNEEGEGRKQVQEQQNRRQFQKEEKQKNENIQKTLRGETT